MEFLMAFASVSMICLIVAILAYVIVTNRIIKDQEKQIAKLTTEKFRLQAAIHKESRRKVQQIIEIRDDRIDPENVPTFGDN